MLKVMRTPLIVCVFVLAAVPLRAQRTERPPKSSSTLITEAEIERARPTVGNAYDVVQSLRPRWLRTRDDVGVLGQARGDMQLTRIHVYMDDREVGDLEFLRSIPAEHVFTLRYVSTNEAGSRFGPSSGPGIVVTLKP